MKLIDTIYIDGAFVKPHGSERFDLVNPSTEAVIGQVTLGDEIDTQNAVDAAVRAFPAFSRTSRSERIAILRRLHDALMARSDDLNAATIEEYGAPQARAQWSTRYAAEAFLSMATTLETYEFTRRVNTAEVVMEPVGVVGLITPWNANAGFICNKLATAIAAGCTTVIKPSEMSALQTQVVIEALHEAGLPPGVFNVVNGLGSVVGATLAAHPKIAKISFTGSTAVGKSILRTGAETMKRVTLELGGKSPTLLLDDANFAEALPLALNLAFMNSGQACIAGTRLLVPEQRLDEVIERVRTLIAAIQSGDPYDPATTIGPMVNRKQYERVQHYIRVGEEEGATLIAGGAGRPEGLTRGYFVKPTVFAHVTNDMTIAREEIFGPVLSILAYRSEEEAIEIANDTVYGLQASVFSSNPARARSVASRLDAGRVLINGVHHDPLAPFGGHKQSGIGREYGAFGLEAYLEPKTLLGAAG
ncbi:MULTISPECIES: aldehyde dehydrogenase family protein [Paraburkholderia]|uniref:aldehyde dehydrogenase family protein n=1 Tax=Paraburkholderia TaxID=1822464 RepID=UPI002258D915|nr:MULTISPECIES: aldehyde dehydrogenase family protein [Paraburkholderia]MCX4160326.1 aldehyde dehydrogenase family protein [Paraburkholderia megapolitana]MDN7155825.1 aldehyde dehydrogenase family protein [Paraburkholderia sp. CHISQ3]MDQ6492869.1 aldehyde dehydrogenase family protein [Paraburkholderia megapolitana]